MRHLLMLTTAVVFALCPSCRRAEPTPTPGAELPSASSAEQSSASAVKLAEPWLALVDEGKYGESWDAASEAFQRGVAREKWSDAAGAVRGPLGKLLSRSVKLAEYKTSLPGAPDGKYVVIQFNASFEHKQEALETVTLKQESNDSWKAAGYFIR